MVGNDKQRHLLQTQEQNEIITLHEVFFERKASLHYFNHLNCKLQRAIHLNERKTRNKKRERHRKEMFPKLYGVASHLSQKETSIKETIQSHYKLAFSHLPAGWLWPECFNGLHWKWCRLLGRFASWMSLWPEEFVPNCCWRNAAQANADAGGHDFPQWLRWIVVTSTLFETRIKRNEVEWLFRLHSVTSAERQQISTSNVFIAFNRNGGASTLHERWQWPNALRCSRRKSPHQFTSSIDILQSFEMLYAAPITYATKKNDMRKSAPHCRCREGAVIITI